jgi:hypothetical protein
LAPDFRKSGNPAFFCAIWPDLMCRHNQMGSRVMRREIGWLPGGASRWAENPSENFMIVNSHFIL